MRTAAHHNTLATVIRSLAAESSPACLLDTRGTFLFVNDAWDRHALETGGAPCGLGSSLIGTSWLDHIRGAEARQLHASLLERVLRTRGPHPRPITQVGESNTATTAALISTRLEPVLQGGEPIAIRIVHRTVRVRPVEEVYEVVQRSADAYRDGSGAIAQCSCCRRVRDPADPERWDFVPDLVNGPQSFTHGVCQLCAELHYGIIDAI